MYVYIFAYLITIYLILISLRQSKNVEHLPFTAHCLEMAEGTEEDKFLYMRGELIKMFLYHNLYF